MTSNAPEFRKPHLDKLNALLRNQRLPTVDISRVQEAVQRYHTWIEDIENIQNGQNGTIRRLVDATNEYKLFVELTLIFDSQEDFLYRQRGQLKLDNTILEEFLPRLLYKGLDLGNSNLEFRPGKTFAGLSFMSSLSNVGIGGRPTLRTKDQDVTLSKRLYIMTSFEKDFSDAERLESDLGYVCIECKTNLDKTMFQEAVATSRDLKTAIPSSLYFLVSEFLDMTPVPIITTHIDDVLIVRKAKRMSSNLRQQYRSAKDRQRHRDEYAEFLNRSGYYADVFQRMIDKIQSVIGERDLAVDKVLRQGHF